MKNKDNKNCFYFLSLQCHNASSYRLLSYRIESYRHIISHHHIDYRIDYRIESHRIASHRLSHRHIISHRLSYRIASTIVSNRIDYRIESHRHIDYRIDTSYRIASSYRIESTIASANNIISNRIGKYIVYHIISHRQILSYSIASSYGTRYHIVKYLFRSTKEIVDGTNRLRYFWWSNAVKCNVDRQICRPAWIKNLQGRLTLVKYGMLGIFTATSQRHRAYIHILQCLYMTR